MKELTVDSYFSGVPVWPRKWLCHAKNVSIMLVAQHNNMFVIKGNFRRYSQLMLKKHAHVYSFWKVSSINRLRQSLTVGAVTINQKIKLLFIITKNESEITNKLNKQCNNIKLHPLEVVTFPLPILIKCIRFEVIHI